MKSRQFSAFALAVGFCFSCGGGTGSVDFTCTARNDEVAATIQTTQDQLTELRTADGPSWKWLARVPWFGRYARIERLEDDLQNLQDEGFMLAIACGESLTRRSDLGVITVPRLNGAVLLILERSGAMDVNARRAIGGAASALRSADHQLTDGLTTLANEYDDRTLAYPNPDASPPVPGGERPWLSLRDVVALLGIVTLLFVGWQLMGKPVVRLVRRLPGRGPEQRIGRQNASSGRPRSSRMQELELDESPDDQRPDDRY